MSNIPEWIDDGEYQESTHEKQQEFEKKRNYKIPKTLKELIDEELERDRQANTRQ